MNKEEKIKIDDIKRDLKRFRRYFFKNYPKNRLSDYSFYLLIDFDNKSYCLLDEKLYNQLTFDYEKNYKILTYKAIELLYSLLHFDIARDLELHNFVVEY